jgi:predicted secreted protein
MKLWASFKKAKSAVRIIMKKLYIGIGTAVGIFVIAVTIGIVYFMNMHSNPTSILASNQTVPLDQTNKMIHLMIGKKFLLRLDQNYTWDVNVENQTVVNRVINIMENNSTQWIYKANIPGTAKLTAIGDPICLQEKPPCKTPQLIFRVTIIVP